MKQLLTDIAGPAEAARKLRGAPGFVWLDSGASPDTMSVLGAFPVSRFRWTVEDSPEAFAPALRDWLARFSPVTERSDLPFQGGAIGYLSYDAARLSVERFRSRHVPVSPIIAEFALYDTVLCFAPGEQQGLLVSAGLDEAGGTGDDTLAAKHIARLQEALRANETKADLPDLDWQPDQDRADYGRRVRAVQEEILDGEIYQANLSALWAGRPASADAACEHYLRVREQTPALMSAFGTFEGRTIASFSPERLVSMAANGRVRAEPIKGTIRRGATAAEDRVQRAHLLASAKDRAENVMIVDLLRNDLSRVCEPRSVTVSRLCEIESLPNLHHLVSTIDGDLREGFDAIDLLMSVFPGGSITGAPKLRAMEVIDRLEPAARGIFRGSMGYIGFDGACDFNIMIRTIDHLPGGSHYWSGAGITLLSEPDAEAEEIELKAERILGDTIRAGARP